MLVSLYILPHTLHFNEYSGLIFFAEHTGILMISQPTALCPVYGPQCPLSAILLDHRLVDLRWTWWDSGGHLPLLSRDNLFWYATKFFMHAIVSLAHRNYLSACKINVIRLRIFQIIMLCGYYFSRGNRIFHISQLEDEAKGSSPSMEDAKNHNNLTSSNVIGVPCSVNVVSDNVVDRGPPSKRIICCASNEIEC